jgi:hypothetical protein
MERLRYIRNAILDCIEKEVECLDEVDTEELGEAIDMVKDLEEAMYYAAITKAMGEKEGWGGKEYHRPEPEHHHVEMNSSAYMRDAKEGRSPHTRKMYMEAKEMHHGKEVQMKELENYMQELTEDVVEMIKDSSPEEKQLMQKKIATLAEKVGKITV